MSQYPSSRRSLFALFAALVTASMLGACDTAISPFVESDTRFSVFGQFNVADTRHVLRVEDLRDSLSNRVPREPRLTVELTNTSTGDVFSMEPEDLAFSADRVVRNFVFEGSIDSSTVYRVDIRSPDGASASAEFTTPQGLPMLSMDSMRVCGDTTDMLPGTPTGFSVEIEPQEGDQIGLLTPIYITPSVLGTYPKLNDLAADNDIDKRASYFVDATRDLQGVALDILGDSFQGTQLPPPAIPNQVKMGYGAVGPDFPGSEYLFADFESAALPGNYDNVDGGLGLVFASVTDTVDVPYEREEQVCD
ncbi:hypothetical protein [Longibacter sp.]|uniref:hypothetical protein n=1 Tax=Longibacter sp. TaxID=2045415 RepID=UPI003EBDCF63